MSGRLKLSTHGLLHTKSPSSPQFIEGAAAAPILLKVGDLNA